MSVLRSTAFHLFFCISLFLLSGSYGEPSISPIINDQYENKPIGFEECDHDVDKLHEYVRVVKYSLSFAPCGRLYPNRSDKGAWTGGNLSYARDDSKWWSIPIPVTSAYPIPQTTSLAHVRRCLWVPVTDDLCNFWDTTDYTIPGNMLSIAIGGNLSAATPSNTVKLVSFQARNKAWLALPYGRVDSAITWVWTLKYVAHAHYMDTVTNELIRDKWVYVTKEGDTISKTGSVPSGQMVVFDKPTVLVPPNQRNKFYPVVDVVSNSTAKINTRVPFNNNPVTYWCCPDMSVYTRLYNICRYGMPTDEEEHRARLNNLMAAFGGSIDTSEFEGLGPFDNFTVTNIWDSTLNNGMGGYKIIKHKLDTSATMAIDRPFVYDRDGNCLNCGATGFSTEKVYENWDYNKDDAGCAAMIGFELAQNAAEITVLYNAILLLGGMTAAMSASQVVGTGYVALGSAATGATTGFLGSEIVGGFRESLRDLADCGCIDFGKAGPKGSRRESRKIDENSVLVEYLMQDWQAIKGREPDKQGTGVEMRLTHEAQGLISLHDQMYPDQPFDINGCADCYGAYYPFYVKDTIAVASNLPNSAPPYGENVNPEQWHSDLNWRSADLRDSINLPSSEGYKQIIQNAMADSITRYSSVRQQERGKLQVEANKNFQKYYSAYNSLPPAQRVPGNEIYEDYTNAFKIMRELTKPEDMKEQQTIDSTLNRNSTAITGTTTPLFKSNSLDEGQPTRAYTNIDLNSDLGSNDPDEMENEVKKGYSFKPLQQKALDALNNPSGVSP